MDLYDSVKMITSCQYYGMAGNTGKMQADNNNSSQCSNEDMIT